MYRLQKVDFENIELQERPGGWLAGDFIFDAEHYDAHELETFLLDNPSVMLEMATNLFYYRELGLSMTKMFYIFESAKQNVYYLSCLHSLFERMSAWYEEDETGKKYMLIQGEGISDSCAHAFEHLKEEGKLHPVIQRLYIDSHFSDDINTSGYFHLEKDKLTEPVEITDHSLIYQLFQQADFRNYGSINVSGISMQELEQEPLVKELLELTSNVYLYTFDLCLKNAGEKKRRYVKILRWNIDEPNFKAQEITYS